MTRNDESLIGALRALRPSDLAELLVVAATIVAIIVTVAAVAGRL